MLSKLAVLFTVVAYANAQCGTGGSLVGSNCVCDSGYLCGGSGINDDWGCGVSSSCSCGSILTPCTSFTSFPESLYSAYSSGKYNCISTTDTVYSTSTTTTCNVPKRTDSPIVYNSACATPCKSWTCTDYGSSLSSGSCSSSTCYDVYDLCGSSEALKAAVAIWITYVIVVIVVVVICCCIVPILACFFMGAACFSYRKNANPV